MRLCTLPDNVEAFKISGCGLWSEAYRQKRPILVNDYSMEHAAKVGFPEGHPVLRNFISIPVFSGSHVAAVAALGNKKGDYNLGDVRQLRLFMEGLWQILLQREAEENFRAIADYTYDWEDWIGTDGKLIWVNPAVEKITGYTPEDCLNQPDYPFFLIHDDDRETIRTELTNSLEHETSSPSREVHCISKDNKTIWISAVWQPIYDINGTFMGLRSSLRDITTRKRADAALQQSEANLKAIVENTDDIIVLRDTEGRALIYNKAFNSICQDLFRIDAYPGMRTMDYLNNEEKEHWKDDIHKVLAGETVHRQFSKTFPEGNTRTFALTFNPIFQNKTVIGFSEFTRDITAQKKNEIELREALEEKEMLLGEINHRVKNNLAIISALIRLKESAAGGTIDLTDIKSQINAITIVHKKLYKTGNITHINFREYVQDLLITVFSSFTTQRVTIIKELDNVSLKTKTAVTIGLVINEIATNAIKHGFTEGSEARFSIILKEDTDSNQYVLTLMNTGNPFPEDKDLDHPTTLGLRLISSLTHQIKGTIQLKRLPHPEFTITFPVTH